MDDMAAFVFCGELHSQAGRLSIVSTDVTCRRFHAKDKSTASVPPDMRTHTHTHKPLSFMHHALRWVASDREAAAWGEGCPCKENYRLECDGPIPLFVCTSEVNATHPDTG